MSSRSPDPDDTARLVEDIHNTGMVDLFELNVSCPMPASTVGMHIGKNPSLLKRQIEAGKSVAKVPFTVKLTPNDCDLVEVATVAKEAGADGLTISNSIRSFAGVDIETGHPYLRSCPASAASEATAMWWSISCSVQRRCSSARPSCGTATARSPRS